MNRFNTIGIVIVTGSWLFLMAGVLIIDAVQIDNLIALEIGINSYITLSVLFAVVIWLISKHPRERKRRRYH